MYCFGIWRLPGWGPQLSYGMSPAPLYQRLQGISWEFCVGRSHSGSFVLGALVLKATLACIEQAFARTSR